MQTAREKDPEHVVERLKSPSKQKIIDWIVDAVEHMKTKPELVKKSVTVTGITNALKGTEDHRRHNHEYLQRIISEEDDDNSADDFVGFDEEGLPLYDD